MMFQSVLLSAVLLAAGIHADSHLAAPEGMVKVHVVHVGGEGAALKFFPESLQAEPGSLVQFQFHPKNHSVAQSTFDRPCEQIGKVQPGTPGINSGFMPVAAGAAEIPVWTVPINDTKPIWLYCGQAPHCEKGMVMAINAPATGNKTLELYKAKAQAFVRPSSGGGSGAYPTATGTGSGAQPTGDITFAPSPTPTVPPTDVLGDAPAIQTTNAATPLSVPEFTGFLGLLLAMFAMLG